MPSRPREELVLPYWVVAVIDEVSAHTKARHPGATRPRHPTLDGGRNHRANPTGLSPLVPHPPNGACQTRRTPDDLTAL